MTSPHILSRHPKVPRQERGERRVADLLGAAEQLFATAGYDATTMSAIAKQAGASIGSLYQFFPSKESIGSALLRRYMDELGERLAQWQTSLPASLEVFGQELITVVYDYLSQRPACRVLAETPSLVPKSYRMEKLSVSVQALLAAFAPQMTEAELAPIALAASMMVRAAMQGSRLLDEARGKSLRHEMQQALGGYLVARLGPPVASRGKRGGRAG